MSSHKSHNEGARVLPEFVSEAIPAPGLVETAPPGRGINEDMRVVQEIVFQFASAGLGAERAEELRQLSAMELLALVQFHKETMPIDELKAILHIAVDRIDHQDAQPGAKQLLSTAADLVCKMP